MRGKLDFANRSDFYPTFFRLIFLGAVMFGGILTPANAFYSTDKLGVTATVVETCRIAIPVKAPDTNSPICISAAGTELAPQATIEVTHAGDGDVVLTMAF